MWHFRHGCIALLPSLVVADGRLCLKLQPLSHQFAHGGRSKADICHAPWSSRTCGNPRTCLTSPSWMRFVCCAWEGSRVCHACQLKAGVGDLMQRNDVVWWSILFFFCLPLKRCPRVVNRPPPLLCFACPHRLQLKEDLEPEFARYGTVHRMVVYDTNPEAVVTVEVTRGTELRFGEL